MRVWAILCMTAGLTFGVGISRADPGNNAKSDQVQHTFIEPRL